MPKQDTQSSPDRGRSIHQPSCSLVPQQPSVCLELHQALTGMISLNSHGSPMTWCYCPHFTDKKAEAQGGKVTSPWSRAVKNWKSRLMTVPVNKFFPFTLSGGYLFHSLFFLSSFLSL